MPWQVILGLVLGHIAVIAGCYLTARGINLLLGKPATPAHIFNPKGSVFWGLFAIMGGFCFFYIQMLNLVGQKIGLAITLIDTAENCAFL